jgi:hypothetical protein
MKNVLMLLALVSGALLTSMQADTKAGYQPATVITVESRAMPVTYAGGELSDAPLQPTLYSYDIGIRVGETVYRTRYDSAFEDLPSVLSVRQPLQVNLRRYVLHVELPGDRVVGMPIESRTALNGVSRMAGN